MDAPESWQGQICQVRKSIRWIMIRNDLVLISHKKIIKMPNYRSGLFSWNVWPSEKNIFSQSYIHHIHVFLSHENDSFWPYHFWSRWYFIWNHPEDARFPLRNTLTACNGSPSKNFDVKTPLVVGFSLGVVFATSGVLIRILRRTPIIYSI